MTAWFPWIRRARRVPLLALLMVGARARAQCSTAWVPMPGLCGVHGVVRAALEWDPDGPGPRPAQVVVAGDFRFAGSVAANCIAAWDPVTRVWSPLGSGLNSTAAALAQLANGDDEQPQ